MHTPRNSQYQVPQNPVQPVPVARNGTNLVWASSYDGTRLVLDGLLCVSCSQPVEWAQDDEGRPHFMHTVEEGCGGDPALRTIALEIIWDSLHQAIRSGREHPLGVICHRCQTATHENLVSDPELTISRDQELADMVRSDILIRSGTGDPLYTINVKCNLIEFHTTSALHHRLGLPEVNVWPKWGSLEELRDGFGIIPYDPVTQDPLIERNFDVFVSAYRCRSPRHYYPDPDLVCPICHFYARRIAVEIADANCYECGDEYQILDLVQQRDDGVFRIAASCEDLIGVEMIAADYGVRLESTFSQGAERRYLGHFCGNGHFQGDSIIYRSEGLLDRDRPVQRMIVCPAGHWTKDAQPIPWPQKMRPERVTDTVGLWGVSGRRVRPDTAPPHA